MDLTWVVLGFCLAALAAGYGWVSGDDESPDADAPEDPLTRRRARTGRRRRERSPVAA
jgi:hypothetical protein